MPQHHCPDDFFFLAARQGNRMLPLLHALLMLPG